MFAQARSQARSLPPRAPASDFVRVRLGIRVHQEEDDGPAAEQGKSCIFFIFITRDPEGISFLDFYYNAVSSRSLLGLFK